MMNLITDDDVDSWLISVHSIVGNKRGSGGFFGISVCILGSQLDWKLTVMACQFWQVVAANLLGAAVAPVLEDDEALCQR